MSVLLCCCFFLFCLCRIFIVFTLEALDAFFWSKFLAAEKLLLIIFLKPTFIRKLLCAWIAKALVNLTFACSYRLFTTQMYCLLTSLTFFKAQRCSWSSWSLHHLCANTSYLCLAGCTGLSIFQLIVTHSGLVMHWLMREAVESCGVLFMYAG